jgi:Flp pilus assembly protein TadD
MRGRFEREPRDVIPRWRAFPSAARTDGELSSTKLMPRQGDQHQDKGGDIALQAALEEFEQGQSVWDAADLLVLAASRGEHAVARRVATFVATHRDEATPALNEIASQYLDPGAGAVPNVSHRERAADLRSRVVDFPRNAIAWADLALYLTLAGSFQHAERAMRTALHLAPNNRFILRSASRLYVHQNRLDVAHQLLARADATPYDPWLVAAEIATARSAGTTSRLIKAGRNMLENRTFHPRHISELASALGTTEGDSPTARRLTVRRLIAKSLLDPTENSVAQAQWHTTNTGFGPSFHKDPDTRSILHTQGVYEAMAWQSYIEGDFATALEQAKKWFDDQPFSARPAFLASQLSALLCQDPKLAVEIAERALVPNPNEFMLWNNLAYAKALLGETEDARKAINHIQQSALDPLSKLYVTATTGAIAFRSGDTEEGRRLYMKAMKEFADAGGAREDFDLYALAFAHLAYEEAAAKSPEALEFYNVIESLTQRVDRSDFRAIVKFTGDLLKARTVKARPKARQVTVNIAADRQNKIAR